MQTGRTEPRARSLRRAANLSENPIQARTQADGFTFPFSGPYFLDFFLLGLHALRGTDGEITMPTRPGSGRLPRRCRRAHHRGCRLRTLPIRSRLAAHLARRQEQCIRGVSPDARRWPHRPHPPDGGASADRGPDSRTAPPARIQPRRGSGRGSLACARLDAARFSNSHRSFSWGEGGLESRMRGGVAARQPRPPVHRPQRPRLLAARYQHFKMRKLGLTNPSLRSEETRIGRQVSSSVGESARADLPTLPDASGGDVNVNRESAGRRQPADHLPTPVGGCECES